MEHPKFYLVEDVPKLRGVRIRVVLCSFPGTVRLDVREYVDRRPGDPDTAVPTAKGVNLPVELLPQLAAALRAAEAAAIAERRLGALDYRRARLSMPPEPLPRV